MKATRERLYNHYLKLKETNPELAKLHENYDRPPEEENKVEEPKGFLKKLKKLKKR